VAAELTYIMNSTNLFSAVLFFCGFPSVALHAGPVGTAFLYQGRLIDESKAARDQYDFRSALYDAGTGSNRIGPWVTNAPVAVSKGLFTITLDFGTNIFNGTAYWLEIGVRATGSLSDFTTLAPRQSLAPSPYAHYALKSGGLSGPLPDSQLSPQVARLDLSQTFLGVPLFAPSSGAPFTVGSATKVPNLNADLLDGLDSTAFATALHTHAALDITSGTLDQARLPGNVALREATQTFTGTNIFSHPSNRSARTARTRPGHSRRWVGHIDCFYPTTSVRLFRCGHKHQSEMLVLCSNGFAKAPASLSSRSTALEAPCLGKATQKQLPWPG